MYPSITPLIRDAIKRRYELIPYIYSLALESHLTAIPPQRWIGWGYESDPEVWTPALLRGEEQYWLGDALLIGGVYEPGLNAARMYLPRSSSPTRPSSSSSSPPTPADNTASVEGYINLNAPYQQFPAGQWVVIASEWQTSIPVLAKIGGAVPVGKPVPTSSPLEDREEFPSLVEDDYRGVEIFPPKVSSNGSVWANIWYEDDGLSFDPVISQFTIEYSCTEKEISVRFTSQIGDGGFEPLWKELDIILPAGDDRGVIVGDNRTPATRIGKDKRERMVFRMPVL
jgi:Glycosyl hydrolases family 31